MRILLAAAVICSTLSIHVRLPGSETGEQILLWIGVVMLATIFLLRRIDRRDVCRPVASQNCEDALPANIGK